MIYTGSGNVPYVQFGSVGDFVPEPGARSLQWGYKREGERWGVQEVRSAPTGRTESDRNFATSYVFERVLEGL